MIFNKKLIDLLLYKLGYVKKEFVRKHIDFVADDIKTEIERRKGHPNIGKIGCLKRVLILRELFK